MTGRTIVVTGATGFTGPFVIKALRGRFPDAAIRCFVRSASRRESLTATPGIEFAVGDLRDRSSLVAAFRGADTLVNVASLGFDWIDPLFDAIRDSTLTRGVFISTTAILTRLPVASKPIRERGESLVRASGLEWTVVRPTMIYGSPADRNIARLIRFVWRSPLIPIVAPGAKQQPIHVTDVAAAVVAALQSPVTTGKSYNLAGRDPITLEELVRSVARALGKARAVIPIPLEAARFAVKLYARTTRSPRIKIEQIDRLGEDKAFDYGAASQDFGFKPMSFDEGVRQEIAAMREAGLLP